MNLGGIYKDLGQLDQALTSTLKSLELKPDNPDAHMNLGMIHESANNKELALESYMQSEKLDTTEDQGRSLTSLLASSTILIQLGRIEESQEKLKSANKIAIHKPLKRKNCNNKNKKHDIAYLLYLNILYPEIPKDVEKIAHESLHIGESHCLTFTNQIVCINNIPSRIKPSLIKGAKAFHLGGNEKTNKFK